MYDGPKRDFERLCREFAARARKMARGFDQGADTAKDGDVRDYIKFVASAFSLTAHSVEQCSVLTFEEWREKMRFPTRFNLSGNIEEL